MQRQYWKEYGTSVARPHEKHDVDPDPFLDWVHDVPIEDYIDENPELRTKLLETEATHHLFTNGPAAYARRVLAALGVEDLFEELFDIERHGYVPKPYDEPYDRAARHIAEGDKDAIVILVEDAPRNLPPARERGWGTIWLRRDVPPATTPQGEGATEPEKLADVTIDRIEEFPSAIPAVLEKLGYE